MKKKDVEKEVIREILKSCSLNLLERIIVKRHSKICVKIYKIGITFGFNNR